MGLHSLYFFISSIGNRLVGLDHEVKGWISGTSTILNVYLALERDPPKPREDNSVPTSLRNSGSY